MQTPHYCKLSKTTQKYHLNLFASNSVELHISQLLTFMKFSSAWWEIFLLKTENGSDRSFVQNVLYKN